VWLVPISSVSSRHQVTLGGGRPAGEKEMEERSVGCDLHQQGEGSCSLSARWNAGLSIPSG